MDCRKLHQEIAELGHKYGDVELQCEKAEESGHGEGLKKALFVFDEAADGLLEEYLPDFQEQLGDKLGIKEARIEGEVKGLGDRVVSAPWGDVFAITNEGLFSVVEEETGGLSRGELIATNTAEKDLLGVFFLSSGEIMLSNDDEISVIKKVDNEYSLCDSVSTHETIFASSNDSIYEVAAISGHEWIINTTNGLYVLSYDASRGLSFGEKIDLTKNDKRWRFPGPFLSLSDKELLIGNNTGGAGLFAKNDSGELTHVMNIFEIRNPNGNTVGEVMQITDNKWLLRNLHISECRILSRDDSSSQPRYELSGPIYEMVAMSVRYVSYLSNNDFLIENSDGDVFVYTMQSDGSLKETSKIDDRAGICHIKYVIPLSDDAWLVNKHFTSNFHPIEQQLGKSYILRRKENGKYEFGERLEGVHYVVQGAIRLPDGRFLLSDHIYNRLKKNELDPMNHDLSILNTRHTFNDIDDLKKNLDRIIKIGEASG